MLVSQPSDAAGLFACYDETLLNLVDRHAPFADVKVRAHKNAPWYNEDCRSVKAETRRLECIYRKKESTNEREAWHDQSRYQCFFFHEKYVHYWTNIIKSNTGDSKALRSKVSALLKTPSGTSSASAHSADKFAEHFRNKVDTIRSATTSASPPTVEDRPCTVLSTFK